MVMFGVSMLIPNAHICSGIFTYIYHKHQLNVGRYSIHGASGNYSRFDYHAS